MSKFKLQGILSLALFSFFSIFYIFFKVVDPAIPFSGDDWNFLESARLQLWPSLSLYNPARIFPETFMPIWGIFSAYIVTPLVGNYLEAFIISRALVLALFITLLCYYVQKILYSMLSSENDSPANNNAFIASILLMSIFICTMFSFFNTHALSANIFISSSITITFFYQLPNLMNSILLCVLIYWQYHDKKKISNPLLCGFLLTCLYLAQFSMTFASLILATYAGSSLLIRLIAFRFNLTKFVKNANFLDLSYGIILSFWIIAAIFDMSGPRFNDLNNNHPIEVTISNLINVLSSINFYTAVLSLLVFSSVVFTIIKSNNNDKFFTNTICSLLLSSFLCLLADVLIEINNSIPLRRSEIIYNFVFLFVLSFTISLTYLIKKYHFTKIILPLITLFFITSSIHDGNYYKKHTDINKDFYTVNAWITEIKNATAKNEQECTIYYPSDTSIRDKMAVFLPRSLYLHSQIPYMPKVHLKKKDF